jgi:hypothetical protein
VRILAALVLILAVVLIGMVARGEFGPSTPQPARGSGSPMATRATPTPTAPPTSTGSRTITVTLTEQELTKAARDYTPLTVSGITVSDPTIKLDAGKLTLTATGRAFIVSGPVVVVASPVVSNGTATAKIESATFAGLNLPESTKQDVADTFTRVLASNIPSGVRVTSVTVKSGTLVIEAAAG